MESKTIGGSKVIYNNELRKMLLEHPALYKYEPTLILKAFKKTMWYFINNAIEFEFKNFFKFKKIHKKDAKNYVRWRDEYQVIPEHDDIVLKPYRSFKDYMNSRGKFKDSAHREQICGLIRKSDIF